MMNKELVAKLDQVPTKTKTAFTRIYNNLHSTKGIKSKKEKKKITDDDEEEAQDDLYDPDKIEEKNTKNDLDDEN